VGRGVAGLGAGAHRAVVAILVGLAGERAADVAAVTVHLVAVVALLVSVDHRVAAPRVHALRRATDTGGVVRPRARGPRRERRPGLARVQLVAALRARAVLAVVAHGVVVARERAGPRLAAVEGDVVSVLARLAA